MQLKKGSLLQGGKYRIEKMLGQGGFGITYLAEQPMLERKVCVKEFFFKDYCEREESTSHVTLSTKSNTELVDRFRKKFLKEARVISKLHHDHIVQIHDIFEENSTAYYVMDYVEGESLGDMIKRTGYLPEQQALAYIKDVASALAYIHSKSINHLDIKPGNIMLRHEDQRILLIDFGVSKQYDEATFEGTTTTPVGISHGYSPAEQYRKNGVQSFSPQSDVYSLSATLYKLLTGVTPPEAIEIQDEGLPLPPLNEKHVSSTTITAIVKAMKPRSKRTQSVEAFVADLNEPLEVTAVVAHIPEKKPEPVTPKSKPQQKKPQPPTPPQPAPEPEPEPEPSHLMRNLIIAVVALFVMILGYYLFSDGKTETTIQTVTDYPIMANDGSVIYTWTGELTDQNLPTGRGVAVFASDDKQARKEYHGEMNNGLFEDSLATLYYTNGSTFEGIITNGKLEYGTLTVKNDGAYYTGTFKDDKEYNGEWRYIEDNGIFSTVVNGKEYVK